MRTFLLVAPILACAVLLACESDSSSGSGTFPTSDGGLFDAPSASDGPSGGDAPSGAGVTVRVTRAGLAASGIQVVFHDDAGAVLEVVTTGASGEATSTGVAPAMASALLGGDGAPSRRIVTWVGVKPGDVLLAVDELDPTVVGHYDVSFEPFAGAVSYAAASGACAAGGAVSPISIPLSKQCLHVANSVLAIANDGAGTPLAFAFAKGAPPPAPDGGTGAVALGAWLTPAPLEVTVTNAPAGSLDAIVAEYSEGGTYLGPTKSFTGGTTTLQYAPGFAEALQPVLVHAGPAGGVRSLIKRVAPSPTVAFDFATALPALLTGTRNMADLKRPVLSWTAASPLSKSDGGDVILSWRDAQERPVSWTLVVPPTATTVKAPALPAEASAWLPASSASRVDATVVFVDVDSLASYDGFRSVAGQASIGADLFAGGLLAKNGQLATTTFVVP
jgi:hypothetical protein